MAVKKTKKDIKKDVKKAKEPINAIALLKGIEDKILNPKDFTNAQLDACIEFLKHKEGWSNVQIADHLNLNRNTVKAHLEKMDAEFARQLANKGYSVESIAAKNHRATEFIKSKAVVKKDWRLWLEAHYREIDELHRLGLVYEKPKEHVIDISAFTPEEKAVIVELAERHIKEQSLAAPEVIDVSPRDTKGRIQ